MFSREELLKSPEYWFEGEQDELFRQVSSYMEQEQITQTELSKRLHVSKGYVSQILNGEFNFTLKKIIEIGLAIGLVPQIRYRNVRDVIIEDRKMQAFYDYQNTGDNIIPIGKESESTASNIPADFTKSSLVA